VVERFLTSSDAEEIAAYVKRRTVFTLDDLRRMAQKPTKVILFRMIKHFSRPIPYTWLIENGVVNGYIQTIQRISDEGYRRVSKMLSDDVALLSIKPNFAQAILDGDKKFEFRRSRIKKEIDFI
jgi:hypothetical protein